MFWQLFELMVISDILMAMKAYKWKTVYHRLQPSTQFTVNIVHYLFTLYALCAILLFYNKLPKLFVTLSHFLMHV
jgi:TRAP-type mannitol/chloroaromatic compound transport system permease small subunit